MSAPKPMVVAPSAEDVAFLVHAIREHSKLYRRNGAVVPAGVDQLVELMSSGVTRGHAGSTSAPASRTEQVGHMTPRLVTYETAADLLAVSVSSVKRLIKAGDLHPVALGGASRLRVAEVDDYIQSLDQKETA